MMLLMCAIKIWGLKNRPVYKSVKATAENINSKKSITDVEINALNSLSFKSKDHLVQNIKGIESRVCQTVRNHENHEIMKSWNENAFDI